jgi:hypothetical protein
MRVILLSVLALLSSCKAAEQPVPIGMTWHVLTALPLFFGEGNVDDVLNGKSAESPLIKRLNETRRTVPLDILDQKSLTPVKYLLAIQPARLPPDELVAFDAWVRGGGRALIFADPDLVWPLALMPGDPRQPPGSTLLDPLFAHWGLTLEGMRDRPRAVSIQSARETVVVINSGRWTSKTKACVVSDKQLVVTCSIGMGRVTLIADVDLADPRLWDEQAPDNFSFIRRHIESLETKKS